MNSFNPDASFSNMWKAYNAMPTKTTALDRIIQREKSAQQSHIQQAISEAKSADHIKSKMVSGDFFKRFDQAKAEQARNTQENINELRRFVGKGMRIDRAI